MLCLGSPHFIIKMLLNLCIPTHFRNRSYGGMRAAIWAASASGCATGYRWPERAIFGVLQVIFYSLNPSTETKLEGRALKWLFRGPTETNVPRNYLRGPVDYVQALERDSSQLPASWVHVRACSHVYVLPFNRLLLSAKTCASPF